MDEWLGRQLLAERAWTRRSVLGGLFSNDVQHQVPTVTADRSTGGRAAEITLGIA